MGIKFATFEWTKRVHNRIFSKKSISNAQNFIYGSFAACVALTVTFPTDVMRRIMQLEAVRNSTKRVAYLSKAAELYREEGVRGFFKGLKATYYKSIPSIGLAFMINEYMKRKLKLTH